MFHNKMIKNIIDTYIENNVENYGELVRDNWRLSNEIEQLRSKKKRIKSEKINKVCSVNGLKGMIKITKDNVNLLNEKGSGLYDPVLYKELIKNQSQIIMENEKNKKFNEEINKKIEEKEKNLNDKQHSRCALFEKVKIRILDNLIYNDYVSYKYKEFLKNELLLRNFHYADNMEILEDVVDGVERNDENYTLEKMEQRGEDDVYKVFLIVRKYLEIFSHDPKIFLGDNVQTITFSCTANRERILDMYRLDKLDVTRAMEQFDNLIYYLLNNYQRNNNNNDTAPSEAIRNMLQHYDNFPNEPILNFPYEVILNFFKNLNKDILNKANEYCEKIDLRKKLYEHENMFDSLYSRELTNKKKPKKVLEEKKKLSDKEEKTANEILESESKDFLSNLINAIEEQENIGKTQKTKVKDLKK